MFDELYYEESLNPFNDEKEVFFEFICVFMYFYV